MGITYRDNFSLGNANIGIGTSTAKARTTTNVTQFAIGGRTYFKAATDDLWTLAGTALTSNQTCAFYLWLDATGTASVSQSAISSTSGTGYQGIAFELPDEATKALIGAIVIRSGGSAFTPGTTALTSVATYVPLGPDYGSVLTT